MTEQTAKTETKTELPTLPSLRWDPRSDSSPGHEVPGMLVLAWENGKCGCGCGADVRPGSTFRQGHDARLKGKLQRAHRAGIEVRVITPEGTTNSSAAEVARAALSPALAAAVLHEVKVTAKTPKAKDAVDELIAKVAELDAEDEMVEPGDADLALIEAAEATTKVSHRAGRKVS